MLLVPVACDPEAATKVPGYIELCQAHPLVAVSLAHMLSPEFKHCLLHTSKHLLKLLERLCELDKVIVLLRLDYGQIHL